MRYQPIFISAPSWEEPGPICDTKQEAENWLAERKKWSGRKDDSGYVIEVTPAAAP